MEKLFSRIAINKDVREFEEILNYHRWRHRIPIGDNFVTPGYLEDDYWDLSHFPNDLKGKSVLDIGSNDGINSFRAERLGAKEVLGIDLYSDGEEMSHTIGWSYRGCRLAAAALKSKVDFQRLSAYDVATLNRKFDFVLMADVMNWLNDIPTLIREISAICTDTLVIRDGLQSVDGPYPTLRYVHGPQYDLMWLPNRKFMEAILREQGFKHIEFHKINVDRLFDDWVTRFPLMSSAQPISTFASPWSKEPIGKTHPKNEQALSKIGERVFLRGAGWVNVSEVSGQIFEPRGLFKTARKIFGNNIVLKLKSVWSRQEEASYTIIARR